MGCVSSSYGNYLDLFGGSMWIDGLVGLELSYRSRRRCDTPNAMTVIFPAAEMLSKSNYKFEV